MIGDELKYQYLNANTPLEKINYSFSKFHGIPLLNAWRESRIDYLRGIFVLEIEEFIFSVKNSDWESNEYLNTDILLDIWIESIYNCKSFDEEKIFVLLKRFEVTKKIYWSYSKEMRPQDKNQIGSMKLFGKWGIVLALLFQKSGRLPLLNALLKVNDIILSNPKEKPPEAIKSVKLELDAVEFFVDLKLKYSW